MPTLNTSLVRNQDNAGIRNRRVVRYTGPDQPAPTEK